MKQNHTRGIILVVALLTTIPYGIAVLVGGADFVFGGFLLNPIDGNSYLAKMYQGWQGIWQFNLPYTTPPGEGTYLFLFYLALGHLARLTNLSLILTFHLARLAGIILMGYALSGFYRHTLPEKQNSGKAMMLASFGGGLGWLALPFAYLTSDYWVAEAYPFLSAYANPHFPLAIALILWLFIQPAHSISWVNAVQIWTGSVVLGILLPFGVILSLVVLTGKVIWDYWETHQIEWQKIALVCLGGGPVLAYQLSVTLIDPQLAQWNSQNLTPSPPWWDFLISFSPVLLLAGWGVWTSVKHKPRENRLLIIWGVLGLLLIYLPFGLQRRFILGLYIPLVGLAILGIQAAFDGKYNQVNRTFRFVFLLSLPTYLILVSAGIFGSIGHEYGIYLTQGENRALQWIKENTPANVVIAASPDMGLFIPAHTGRRVIYGHPFETVKAEEQKAVMVELFSGDWGETKSDLLIRVHADYIFLGPREREIGNIRFIPGLHEVYRADGINLYAVPPVP